jgi:hypothetical protein
MVAFIAATIRSSLLLKLSRPVGKSAQAHQNALLAGIKQCSSLCPDMPMTKPASAAKTRDFIDTL